MCKTPKLIEIEDVFRILFSLLKPNLQKCTRKESDFYKYVVVSVLLLSSIVWQDTN